MRRAVEHRPQGDWPAGAAVDSLTLDFEGRHRRRRRLVTDRGETVLLDLPKAVAMADGDGLRLEDAGWLRIRAAPETLLEIRTGSAPELARIAWHLGNRHLAAEVRADAILIRPDHVIEDMVQRLGAETRHLRGPFQPEGGAYEGQHQHGHAHDHDHGHEH
jgi:urease accessory protein